MVELKAEIESRIIEQIDKKIALMHRNREPFEYKDKALRVPYTDYIKGLMDGREETWDHVRTMMIEILGEVEV